MKDQARLPITGGLAFFDQIIKSTEQLNGSKVDKIDYSSSSSSPQSAASVSSIVLGPRLTSIFIS